MSYYDELGQKFKAHDDMAPKAQEVVHRVTGCADCCFLDRGHSFARCNHPRAPAGVEIDVDANGEFVIREDRPIDCPLNSGPILIRKAGE